MTAGPSRSGSSHAAGRGRRPLRWARLRWPARLVAVLGALVVGLLATAGPAAAHDVLISSDPANGATLSSAPSTVSFTFDQPVQNYDPVLLIFGPNGNDFTSGKATVVGDVISAPMAAGPAGAYRAVYRIVSADGHPVSGEISFTLTAAAAGTASGTPTSGSTPAGSVPPARAGSAAPGQSSGGLSIWLWVGIGVAAVLVIGAIAVALRRPGSTDD